MPKWHFLVVLDSDEYQFLEMTIITHVYHVLIIGYVVYTLFSVSACSCIGYASHMHIRCTFTAHTLTFDMFCIHTFQLSLSRPFSTYNMFLCLCHAQVYIKFRHPQYVMFTLCFVALYLQYFTCYIILVLLSLDLP